MNETGGETTLTTGLESLESKYKILAFFKYEHLPPDLQKISQMFAGVALQMAHALPVCEEVSAGLRKLLEAKDCAVRAAL